MVFPLIEETHRHAGEERSPRTVSLRELLSLPLLGAYILVFGDYLYIGFDLTLFPLWMHDHLGASVAVIGLAYIAWGIPNDYSITRRRAESQTGCGARR